MSEFLNDVVADEPVPAYRQVRADAVLVDVELTAPESGPDLGCGLEDAVAERQIERIEGRPGAGLGGDRGAICVSANTQRVPSQNSVMTWSW